MIALLALVLASQTESDEVQYGRLVRVEAAHEIVVIEDIPTGDKIHIHLEKSKCLSLRSKMETYKEYKVLYEWRFARRSRRYPIIEVSYQEAFFKTPSDFEEYATILRLRARSRH